MMSTGQRPVMLIPCVKLQCLHKEWKWEVRTKTKSFPVVCQERREVFTKAERTVRLQTNNRDVILIFVVFIWYLSFLSSFKEDCTPGPIHISNGRFLLLSCCCCCCCFTAPRITALREAQGKGGKEEQRREKRERQAAGREQRRGAEGVFAAEGKAEFLGSRKWDRLPPRSLCCVYVLCVCVFLQGRLTLHQHRSGLHVRTRVFVFVTESELT